MDLSQSSGFSFGFEESKDVSFSDWSLHISDNWPAGIVQKFNSNLKRFVRKFGRRTVFNLDPNCSGPYFIIDLAENLRASLELRKISTGWRKFFKCLTFDWSTFKFWEFEKMTTTSVFLSLTRCRISLKFSLKNNFWLFFLTIFKFSSECVTCFWRHHLNFEAN